MSIRDDMVWFNNAVPKSGTVGIGDYLQNALIGGGLIHSKDPHWWFVDPQSGSDAYDGDSWNAPFKTIQAAVDAAGDGRGDTIFLLSGRGYDYDDDTVGASLANAYVYINKADINLVGLGPPNSVVIKPDAAATAGVIALGASAARVRIANLTINTATAQSAAIVTSTGASYPTVENCIFDLVGASGPLGYGINFGGAKVSYPVIRGCTFHLGTLIKAGIALKAQDATPFGALIEDCVFMNALSASGTPCEDGINVMDGTGVIIRNCHISGGASTDYNLVDGIDIDASVLNTLIADCTIGNCDNGVTDGGTDTAGATAAEGWTDTTHA